MRKILCLILTAIMLFSLFSCDFLNSLTGEKLPSPDEYEWQLIYARGDDTEMPPVVYDEAAKALGGSGARLANAILTAKDGILYIKDEKTGSITEGKYTAINDKASMSWGDYEVLFGDLKGAAAVTDNELRDWDTENTGFDGNRYGKYSFSIVLGGYEMLFISKDK